MKTNITNSSEQAFSMVDLLIVIATIVVIAGVVWPMTRPAKVQGTRHSCINNLKQVGIGFRLWAIDGESYPEYNKTNDVWQYFQIVGKEIGSPKVLMCPEDSRMNKRTAALDFETPQTITANNFAHPTHQNNDLSYFYSPDATEERPDTILAGDKNISTNNTRISGLLTVKANTPVQWTKGPHKMDGNILLADGSAQQVSTAKLREAFRIQTNVTQRLLIP